MFVFMLSYLIGRDGWERHQAARTAQRSAKATEEGAG
jgi:hypothetical protein